MKNITLPLLVLLLLTVPQLLDAQQRGRGRGAFLEQQNPIEAFLQRADSLELGLSNDQALRLEMLSEELDETKAPAGTHLRSFSRNWREARTRTSSNRCSRTVRPCEMGTEPRSRWLERRSSRRSSGRP